MRPDMLCRSSWTPWCAPNFKLLAIQSLGMQQLMPHGKLGLGVGSGPIAHLRVCQSASFLVPVLAGPQQGAQGNLNLDCLPFNGPDPLPLVTLRFCST